ncbi:hypothetical protein ABDJ41_10295 [Pedobacter sp. ASV1-7]|uniref:hypothetical protein n=1 Tax=Pedobacter sp. ASV1-7 TaxID=3145237 RepID=UPI0032E879C9
MKLNKLYFACMGMLILLLATACNKGEVEFLYKGDMLPVTLKGYNGSSEQLIVKIDTFKFKYELGENSTINLSDAYTFPEDKNKAILTISERSTGKLVLERELDRKDGPTTISLLYIDGKVSDMPEVPAVEEGKVKMYYMFVPNVTNFTGLVDIEAVKIDNLSGAIERIGRINNVKPFEFTAEQLTFSTFKTGIQEINGVRQAWNLYLRIYKAGTNEYYTNGTGYTWHENSSNPGKAAASTASSTLYIVGEAPSGTQMRFRTLYSK